MKMKTAHEKFVTSENGTSNEEVLSLVVSVSLTPMLSSLLFPWLVSTIFTLKFGQDVLSHLFIRFLIEFGVIAVSTLFLLTFIASWGDEPAVLGVTAILFSSCVLILIVNHALTRPMFSSLRQEWNKLNLKPITNWGNQDFLLVSIREQQRKRQQQSIDDPDEKYNKKSGGGSSSGKQLLPFLTNYRGIITYMTLVCILAVDFPIFPRRYAKTKKFGVSLMDIGTCCFIFSNGIVSPESKNRAPNLMKAIKSSLPLLILGFARVLTVKGTEYQEVVEEYGVHWNFFFTIASVKILSALIFTVVKTESVFKVFVALSLFHEFFLVRNNFQNDYILNPKVGRSASLIDANREGIYSTVGYLSIYMASVYCGKVIYSKKRVTYQDWIKYLIQVSLQSLVLWPLFYLYHGYGNPSSRRVANLGYILWSLAMNFTGLSIQVFLTLVQSIAQQYGLLHGPMISYHLYLKHLKEQGRYFEPDEMKPPKTIEPIPKVDTTTKQDEEEKKKNTITGEEVNEALDLLDRKLDQMSQSPEGVDQKELQKYLKQVERELENLGKHCQENEGDEQGQLDPNNPKTTTAEDKKKYQRVNSESTRKIAHLPDLARASLFFEAICFNNLGLFLLANLLTGVVNYSVDTMYARSSLSLSILLLYTFILYFASFILYWFNIQLKCW